MKERIKKLKEAILIERKAELNRYAAFVEEQGVSERIKAGITLYPLAYVGSNYSHFEELILDFEPNKDQDPYQFSSNGRVSLFSGNHSEKVEGLVVRFRNNMLSVQLSDNELPDWIKSGKIGLNALPDTRTFDVQLDTLEKIEKEELPIATAFYKNAPEQTYSVSSVCVADLNDSQNEGFSHLLSSNPFHIIHGPPGTGKTRTITAAICALASQGKKILVVAPSNAAVDHITHELIKKEQIVLRIGNSFKISDQVLPHTLKSAILNDPLMDVVKRLKKEAESLRKKAFRYKRNFGKEEYLERKELKNELKSVRKDIRRIEREISADRINNAQIITGTFIGLQDRQLSKIGFDAVFIDEAGQALEPLVWSVAHFAPKLFLAGDPLQLPPSLFTNEAKKMGLGISLIESGISNKNGRTAIPTTLLNVQYRMHEKIMHFSNAAFYDNQLRADGSVAQVTLPSEIHEPIEFIDTAGCGYEEVNDELGGIYNPGEAQIMQKRLAEIDLTNLSLGLISPYRRQVSLLQETLENLSDSCQTIDSFQGQERDLILLSLTRSNTNGTIGFLTDYRRMNVAMTRAKKKLIIIGDSATIGNDRFYQGLLEYIEKEGSYRSAWEFLT